MLSLYFIYIYIYIYQIILGRLKWSNKLIPHL
ncbi:hypothetical protein BRC2024_AWKCSVWU_CDS_0046 [Acinetobacter phage vB_AbaP_ABW132]